MSRKPASKPAVREAVILLIDVGVSASQKDRDGESFIDKCKKCASRIIQRKVFSFASDEFGLVYIGSEKTLNELDYPNIQVKNKLLMLPNWEMLKAIEQLSSTTVDNADWLDGLIVAVDFLKNESEAKKFTMLKIVMMSNFGTPLRSTANVEDVIYSMKDANVNLVVIGPEIDEDGEDNSEEDQPLKTKAQRKVEAVIGRIVEQTGGIVCSFDEAMEQLQHAQKVVAKAAPWYCDLQIGENIFIPITGFKKFSPKSLLTWKKKRIDDSDVTQETVFFEGDAQVEKEDVINCFAFGQTVVPISADDKMSMALINEKCFQLIGFTKRERVPRNMSLGDSAYYIVPRSDNKSACVALTALVKAMLELMTVGIVRKVYSKNSAPRLGALIPTCEQESYFLYFVPLPFAEDERPVKLPSLSRVKPTQAQLDAVSQLIDDMDLTQLGEDGDPYQNLVNPALENTYNMIVLKALNPNAKLPEGPSDAVKSLITPKPEILENASASLDTIKRLFQLEEVEQKTYKRGAAHVFDRNVNGTGMEVDNDVKPQNISDIMSFVQSSVTEVGTVDPEGNFLKLLELNEPFSKVCEQMQIAIKKLLLTSSSAVGIQKPVSAMSLLRKHCISQNPLQYNIFIASVKDELAERDGSEFWDQVVQGKLGLITSNETSESSVSSEEAATFYEMKKIETQSEVNYEMEAEDMLDMI